MHPPSQQLRTRIAPFHVLVVLAVLFAGGCGGGSDTEVADVLARERAAALFDGSRFEDARTVLAPLVTRDDPAAADLVRAACVELELARPDLAHPLFSRARDLEPDRPDVHWGFYRLAMDAGENEEALAHVRRVHELAPDDIPTRIALASRLLDLGEAEEAEEEFLSVIALGPEFAGSWYLTAEFRYWRMLLLQGRTEEAEVHGGVYEELTAKGMATPGDRERLRGTFGVIRALPAGEVSGASAEELLRVRSTPRGPEPGYVAEARNDVAGLAGVAVVHLQDSRLPADAKAIAHRIEPTSAELLLWGDAGLRIARRTEVGAAEGADGVWAIEVVLDQPVTLAAGLDLDDGSGGTLRRDGDLDLVAATAEGLLFLERRGEEWVRGATPVLDAAFAITDIEVVDFDHEGDLDLLAVGPGGVRLLRNDGVPSPGGVFTDVTADAGLPRERAFRWCLVEDFDVDGDVDLLLGGADETFLASNERGGRFADASASLPVKTAAGEPLAHDLLPDGRPDLLVPGAPTRLWAGGFDARWTEVECAAGPGAGLAPDALHAAGAGAWATPSLLWVAPGNGLRVAPPLPPDTEVILALDDRATTLAVGDVNGDGVTDVVSVDGNGLRVHRGPTAGNFVRLELEGRKDSRRGVGAIVEVRAGATYQRRFWTGAPETFGLGGSERADIVRVTWPNGVVQTEMDLAPGSSYVIRQKEGLVGSCPFLYTWNGTTYTFISDVIGITPLGLPMDYGLLVPPDHDEYVHVRGDQMVPKDGFYEVQFTEELREVTYLDRIRLDVIDHPAGTEIHPNERFTFPPFPVPHTHTVTDPLAPTTATGSDGHDWTAELAAVDGSFAKPFTPRRGQFLGLANPHFHELAFDPARVRTAKKLRLVMTGWLFWTDASVNMAAAGHPSIAFVPPLLQVPGADGEWVQAGPPLGFPAGKLKTMVVDVTPFVDRENPRLRIFSTLSLHWDAIRLAVDDDDTPLVVTPIEPASAELWERGFSAPRAHPADPSLEWFDWDELEDAPRWNQHPGLYTKFGETVELLHDVDDRYVIMGSGDALRVRFSAAEAPPLPEGWVRDYLVFLDGWAKDRDPNSHEALYVEPLPFHGMSGYPYGPGEAFPDDEARRAWRTAWNTRPARRWIEPLAPRRNP